VRAFQGGPHVVVGHDAIPPEHGHRLVPVIFMAVT
jgi:hypothetical protein